MFSSLLGLKQAAGMIKIYHKHHAD